MVKFDVEGHRASQVASCRSMGIFSQLSGGRASLIVFDDIEVPNTAETQGMREKLRSRATEFEWILKPGGRQVGLGTPHIEDTIYDHLGGHGYHKRLWPARYHGEEWMSKFGRHLAPLLLEDLEKDKDLAGRPADPGMFGELDLAEREATAGRSQFAIQMMLDTRPAEAARRPLKVRDLIVTEVNPEAGEERLFWTNDPEYKHRDLPNLAPDGDHYHRALNAVLNNDEGVRMRPYAGAVLAVDPAGAGSDETAWGVGYQLNGCVRVPWLEGRPGGYSEEILEAIALCAKRYKVNAVVVERNFGQGMFGSLLAPYLRKHHPCRVEEAVHTRQKELRIIQALEPLMNQHRLAVDPAVIREDHQSIQKYGSGREVYSLVHQMTRITPDKGCLVHDDRLDCLAMVASYFTAAAAQSAEEGMKRDREEDLDREIAEFIASWDERVGRAPGAPREPTWGGGNRALRGRSRPASRRNRRR